MYVYKSNENKNENHIFLKMGTSPKSSEPRHNFQQMKKNIVSNLIRALMNWDLSRGGSDAWWDRTWPPQGIFHKSEVTCSKYTFSVDARGFKTRIFSWTTLVGNIASVLASMGLRLIPQKNIQKLIQSTQFILAHWGSMRLIELCFFRTFLLQKFGQWKPFFFWPVPRCATSPRLTVFNLVCPPGGKILSGGWGRKSAGWWVFWRSLGEKLAEGGWSALDVGFTGTIAALQGCCVSSSCCCCVSQHGRPAVQESCGHRWLEDLWGLSCPVACEEA